MGLFIRRQSYRRAHDPAIFCNTLNQCWDDQERYWQHGSRMSNTLLGAKQSTGNLSRSAAARHTPTDRCAKMKAFRHSAINIDWTACICWQIKTNFLWNFRGPPTHTSQVAWSVKHNLAPKMSTLTETSFGFGILSMKKKEERNHFPPRVSPGQLLFRRNQLDGF